MSRPMSPAVEKHPDGLMTESPTEQLSEEEDEPNASDSDSESVSNGHAPVDATNKSPVVLDFGQTACGDDVEYSEDEDSEEDSEDDEEEEEPALKYERMGGAVPDLLQKDSASALAISDKVIVRNITAAHTQTKLILRLQALGTHGGIVHILELTGKRVKSFKPHMASVVDICLDATADYVGTASIDGEEFCPVTLVQSSIRVDRSDCDPLHIWLRIVRIRQEATDAHTGFRTQLC